MSIKNIIFDLDNTLVNADRAYEVALNSVGLTSTKKEFLEARKQVKDRLPKGHVAARNRLLYFKALLDQHGKFSSNAVMDLMSVYEKNLYAELRNQMKRLKRTELFIKLKKKKLRMAILTNENLRTQLVKLKAIDRDGEFFSYMLTSEEFGFEKPDPRVYQEILSATGFKPEETLMVGDDVEADMDGAKAVGLGTVLVCEFIKKPSEKPKNADHMVQSLNEILRIL